MAAFLFSIVSLWLATTIFTGSPKVFPLLLLSLCIIILAFNGTQFFIWPFEENLTDELIKLSGFPPKKSTLNKQYEFKMITDKRFRQNHTKYLRFKAFAAV